MEENRLQLYEPRHDVAQVRVKNGGATGLIEEQDTVPDLREYWSVIRKRYATVFIVMLIVFTIGLFATFRGKPVYEARTLIEIQKENPDVPTLQELFQIEGVSDTYIETQNRILKRRESGAASDRAIGSGCAYRNLPGKAGLGSKRGIRRRSRKAAKPRLIT